MSASLLALLCVLGTLATVGFGPGLAERLRSARRGATAKRGGASPSSFDPGRELRAERKARELLRVAVGEDDYEMYERLGFMRVGGRGGAADAGYAYLIYPHRPIVAYDTESGELLSEYCVGFPDRDEAPQNSRLPDADDVLAKWMSLHGDERGLISDANMHLPGRQIDPGQVHRDLRRLGQWETARMRPEAAA